MTWQDSVELKGCQGMIPTTANIDRVYTVTGETVYNGIPAVAIQRRDSIHAHGEGAQQQHQMIISAAGSGGALIYLSISSGRILGVTTTQDLDLSISASGRTHHFKQSLKQELVSSR
jgi:hypothetical protein